jgi:peptidoglycan/LPS O-acetylase OafA/YrhL
MPGKTKRIEFIDFAKGFAIFYIMVYHFLQPFHFNTLITGLVNFGGSGVHLFFLLSGFGLALSPFTSVKKFFGRRFVSILIPFYIYIIVAFIVSRLTPVFSEFGFDAFLSNILLYKMFSSTYISSFGFHLWFISPLIQLYILYPLLVRAMEKIGWPTFLGITFIISISWMTIIYFLDVTGDRAWNSCFLRYIWEFSLGMAAARMNRDRFKISTINATLLFMGSMVIMYVSLKYMNSIGGLYNDFFALVAIMMFTLLIYRIGLLKWLGFIRKGMLEVSRFSYELYLVHILVFLLLQEILKNAGVEYALWMIPVFIAVVLVASKLFAMLNAAVKSFITPSVGKNG